MIAVKVFHPMIIAYLMTKEFILISTEHYIKPEFNEYHLIRTPVFTSFKPPSAQSEASRMGGGSTSAGVSRKIFRIEVTSAIEYRYFPIEEISAQVYIPRWQPNKGKTCDN